MLKIRPADLSNRGEQGFIFRPWVRYILDHKDLVPLIKHTYASAANRTVAELYNRSTVLVACLETSPDDLFGFVAFEPNRCLHMLYVKDGARRLGVGTDLLSIAKRHLPDKYEYSCKTRQSRKFLVDGTYNPEKVNK